MRQNPAVVRRDHALRRLRRLTGTVIATVAIGVGGLSVLAASAKPGASKHPVTATALAPQIVDLTPRRHHHRRHRHSHHAAAPQTAAPAVSTQAAPAPAPVQSVPVAPQPAPVAPQPTAAPPVTSSGGS